ncbi:Rv3654c family TadE-like protein [Microbacterium sp. ZW T5_56]|uniref:Rv3654c family TadE-like protein n=1 Tax=Microbacterium sp. ZW T5_56 TaxID=3378081 RepID=UPI0038555086
MSGVATAVSVLVATCTFLTGAVIVGEAGVLSQRAAAAADAAALAAADAVTGVIPGDPCVRAGDVAAANGAVVDWCAVSGAVATVVVHANRGILTAAARARAGPPG